MKKNPYTGSIINERVGVLNIPSDPLWLASSFNLIAKDLGIEYGGNRNVIGALNRIQPLLRLFS